MFCLRRFVAEGGGLYTSRSDDDATGDCDRLLLVAAGTAASAQRNHVELFKNGGFICLSVESSSFELRVCHRLASSAEKRTLSFILHQAVVTKA